MSRTGVTSFSIAEQPRSTEFPTIGAHNRLRQKVAFIVSKFPCYDEAFILREIYALSKRMDIAIFSLKKAKEKIIHDQVQALMPKTCYVPYLFSLRIFRAHLLILASRPLRYFRALARLIVGNLKSPEFLIKSLAFFPKAVYLSVWIKQEGITHLHAYWATYPASVALVASEITGISFSFTGHAHDIYLDTTNLREKMNRSSFMTTCTSQNKDYLRKVVPSCPETKILVSYHGLELEQFSVDGKTRNGILQILSVGTLHYYKGFNYLIDALSLLKQKSLDFHCTLIGGGPMESDIRKHIRMLGLEENVTMTGALKQAAVIPYYKSSDLLVLMAQSEWHWGIPNVLIEALAAKTAVITTRFGSVEELIRDGETGLLVPSKDAGVLAEAIERLYADDSLRTRLTQAGHERVAEHFDLEKNIEVFAGRLTGAKASGKRQEEVAPC